jgi:hypothetical protein
MRSPISDLKAGFNLPTTKTARIVDADQYVHNVSSTKQNLNKPTSSGTSTANSGALVIADVGSPTWRYWHYADGVGADTLRRTRRSRRARRGQ